MKSKTKLFYLQGGGFLENSETLNFRFQHSVPVTSQRKTPPQAFLMNSIAVYYGWGILKGKKKFKEKSLCIKIIILKLKRFLMAY
jgi:hypothetical protein